MNENDKSKATPWSWQPPPLPGNLVLLGRDQTEHSNIWFRRFWGGETSLALGAVAGLPGQGDIILSCHLSVPMGDNYRRLDLDVLKCTVKALRFDHPTIASQFAWPDLNAPSGKRVGFRDGRLAYQVPKGELEVEEWLSQVVIDRETVLHACNSDLDQAIDVVRRELGKAVSKSQAADAFQVHFIPSSGAGQKHGIVLLLAHVVFDRFAAFQAMNLFLSKIAEIIDINSDMAKSFAWGEEVERLAKPFPDQCAIPWSAEKTDEDLYMRERFTDPRAFSKTAHGLNIPNPTASPTTTGVIFKTVSSTRLSSLMRSMRKRQCSMFCLLLATSVISTLRTNPPKAGVEDITTPISFIPLNLRPYSGRENEGVENKWEIISALAITIFFAENLRRFVHDNSPRPDKRRVTDDIFTLGREFKEQLGDQRSHMPRAGIWFDDLIGTLLSIPQYPTVAIPMLSSVGIMDVTLPPTYAIPNRSDMDDAVRISNLLCSVRNPYPPRHLSITVHAYTWQGDLRLTFSHPEAHMGSLEKLQACERGLGECEGNVVDYVEEFMNILDIIMDANDEPDDSPA